MANSPILRPSESLNCADSPSLTEAVSEVEAIAMSGASYGTLIRRYVGLKMREWVKTELLGGILTAIIIGLLSVLQGGVTVYAFLSGLLGFCAVIVAFAATFLANAPSDLHDAVQKRLAYTRTQLNELTEPKLTISFVPNPVPFETPFYETFTGADGEEWELYRIAVTSSVPTIAWVKIREAVLCGNRRHNLHLHRMHAEERVIRVELAANEPEYWDIAQKNSKMDYSQLTHIGPKNLGCDLASEEQRLEIIASPRIGPVTTARMAIRVKNEKLELELNADD